MSDSINNNNNTTNPESDQPTPNQPTTDFSPAHFDVADFEVKVGVTATSVDSVSGFTQTTPPLTSPVAALVSAVSRDSPALTSEYAQQFYSQRPLLGTQTFQEGPHVTSICEADVSKKSFDSSTFDSADDLNANFIAPSAPPPSAYRTAPKPHPHFHATYSDPASQARLYAGSQASAYTDPVSASYGGCVPSQRALTHRFHPYNSQLPYSYTNSYQAAATASYYQPCATFGLEQYPHVRNPQIPPQNFLDIPDISQRNSLYAHQLHAPSFACPPRYVTAHHYMADKSPLMTSPMSDVTSAGLMPFEDGGMGVAGVGEGVLTDQALLSAQNVSQDSLFEFLNSCACIMSG